MKPVPAAGKSSLPYWVIGAVAALLILLAVYIMSGTPSEPPPKKLPTVTGAGRSAGPEAAAADTTREDVVRGRRAGKRKAEPVRPVARAKEPKTAYEAHEAARKYEADHPKDFLAAIARYKAVAKKFPDTPEAGIAGMHIARLRSVAGLGPAPSTRPASPDDAARARIPPDAVEHDGRVYRVFKQAVTWGAAKALCEGAGGHLATITSEGENEFVTGLVREAGASAWIGMSDQLARDREGRWAWVTGEEVAFTAWAPGMPNALAGVEQHVCLWKGGEFAWDDHSGLGSTEKKHLFVCEWEASVVRSVRPAVHAKTGAPAAAAEADRQAGEVEDRLASLAAGFDSRIEKQDYRGAKKFASAEAAKLKSDRKKNDRKMKKGTRKALSRALRSAARVAGLLESRRQTIRRAAEALVGQEIRLDTAKGLRRGKLVEVTEAGLTLAIQMKSGRKVIGETRMPVSWKDLTAKQDDRFARDWKPEGPEGALARAVLAIERKEAGIAEREVESAGKHPLARHYAGKVDALRLAEAETSALAAWETIQRWAARAQMTLEQARSLAELTASFEERHGDSKLASSKREEIARAKVLAGRVLVAAGEVPGAVEFAGRRYKLYRYPTRWTAARRFCERLGGHLVTITSREEQDFVAGLAREGGMNAWIGFAAAEAGWRWVTGEKSDFEAWATDRPGGGRPYALVAREPDYVWVGGREDWMCLIICEWEPWRTRGKGRAPAPAVSASEDPFVPPPGHRKIVLLREDFEKGTGGWSGEVAEDEKGRGKVLRLKAMPGDRWNSYRTARQLSKGIAATRETRISFKYRTEGPLSRVVPDCRFAGPAEEGNWYTLVLPPSSGWAHADFPARWLRSGGKKAGDLAEDFKVVFLLVSAGRPKQEGNCFIDEYEVYNVVAAGGP